jgi:hypothetical protein
LAREEEEDDVRVEGSVTTISWIPPQAVDGAAKAGFRLGATPSDAPPPADLGPDIDAALDALADRYRFANHLRGFAEFDADGEVTRYGEQGSGRLGHHTVADGPELAIGSIPMPERRGEPVLGPGWVRFHQTWGGRTVARMAKATLRPPFIRFDAPVAWTTLELTLHASGQVDGRLAGASAFPRHWVYDADGHLDGTSATTDWTSWAESAVGTHTPWGEEDSPAFVTAAESALERELGEILLRNTVRPAVRRLQAGEVLTRQGEACTDLYIVRDGVLVVDVDGTAVVELGPGAVLGERAVLSGGRRAATVTAVSRASVMVVPAEHVDRDRLAGLAAAHRRELPLRSR